MGVDIGEIVQKKTIALSSLSNKIIAIDAFNALYQFLASIRQPDGTPLKDFNGNVTSHLSGLFYRTSKLLENGIRPVYVFDGQAPAFKAGTQAERIQSKKEAEEKWKKALEEERYEDAKKYAQATSRLTGEMIQEAKELLQGLGLPYVEAPSEGEAQASAMAKEGIVYGCASQDYDSLLFGAPILLRNISITGRRKVPGKDKYIIVEPEEIHLEETLQLIGLTREKLIWVGLLCGTDYNKKVPRVGPKTALKIVKEINSLNELKLYVKEKYNHEFEDNLEAMFSFFIDPPVTKIKKLPFKKPIIDSVKKLLCEKHDFSEERVEKTVESLERTSEEILGQSKLDSFF